jgi:molybdopterin converting factor small subunit
MVIVRFYGRLADAIGPEIDLAAAGISVGEVRRMVAAEHSAASAALGRSSALIGDCAVGDDRVVGEADQLEFLPPVSGG